MEEAIHVFANAKTNKSNFNKHGAFFAGQNSADALKLMRHVLLSHRTGGCWQYAPSDFGVRVLLVSAGLIQNRDVPVAEVHDALKHYARKHGLPSMKSYNGYVQTVLLN